MKEEINSIIKNNTREYLTTFTGHNAIEVKMNLQDKEECKG
jgi:hypothetical protein